MIYLYAISAAMVWVHVLGSPGPKVKPFTCDICLSGWIAMALSLAAGNLWQIPFDGALAMLGTRIVKHHLKVN